jgi:hypothetical protein
MIQSDHPAGKRMRRRRGGANRLINCDPPAKVFAASMSHLVPLLEFNPPGHAGSLEGLGENPLRRAGPQRGV